MNTALTNVQQQLPTYDNPPLVETVLSVQFDPLPKLTAAHLGAFWFERRNEWPEVRTQPAIENPIETFGEHWLPQRLELRLSQQPEIRVQMIDAGSERMIQLQRDRLAYNWRRRTETYPRYDTLFQEYKRTLGWVSSFVQSHALGEIKPRQWEVIYINHIEAGKLWQEPDDWTKVLPGLLKGIRVYPEEAALTGIQGQWVHNLPKDRGRLYIDVKPGKTTDKPPKKVLVLRFTARGNIEQPKDVDDGLNLGHLSIVQSFDRLISPEAKELWQRHDHT